MLEIQYYALVVLFILFTPVAHLFLTCRANVFDLSGRSEEVFIAGRASVILRSTYGAAQITSVFEDPTQTHNV